MINVKIMNSYLGLAETEDGTILGIQLFLADKEKEYRLMPIIVRNPSYITAILKLAGVNCWEDLKGSLIQVEIENEKIVKIANILDDEMYLNFSEVFEEEDTSNQEE